LMAYGTFKYRVMDINLIIRKTALYSLVSAILISLYVGIISVLTKTLEGLFTRAPVFSSTIAAATIALLFHPLQLYVQRWLDRRFPRESLDQSLLREATSDFVHEMKRPLANISMPAQLALMDLEQFGDHQAVPALRRRLEYILHESLEAGETIEAIRALSSQTPPLPQSIDLVNILERILDREDSRIAAGKIQVTREFADPALRVKGHAKQLEIALANILKNAIEALSGLEDAKPRRLRVAVQALSEKISVDIEDSGPGIPKADLARLFDPWFSTKGSAGMGIGLFLTREVLRLHNASIEVESREGEGSHFRVVFPPL
jgi:two-component system, NtrC family, sensor kinase